MLMHFDTSHIMFYEKLFAAHQQSHQNVHPLIIIYYVLIHSAVLPIIFQFPLYLILLFNFFVFVLMHKILLILCCTFFFYSTLLFFLHGRLSLVKLVWCFRHTF